jgi:hypothetical protein
MMIREEENGMAFEKIHSLILNRYLRNVFSCRCRAKEHKGLAMEVNVGPEG